MPARAISAMYAASDAANPITPPTRPTNKALASRVSEAPVAGQPEPVDDQPVERDPEREARWKRTPSAPMIVSST